MGVRIDLTGVRPPDCRYVVTGPGGIVKYGSMVREWVCRCDCGAVFNLPQRRIPYCDSNRKSRSAVYACDVCGGRPCSVCGKILPRSSCRTVCDGECEAERAKRAAHASYLRNAELVKRKSAERQKRERSAGNPRFKAQDKRKWERTKADPKKMAKSREKARQFYAEHAARIQARRRDRLTELTPEQLAERRSAWREYQRRYAKKQRAVLRSNPELHTKYLEYLRQYRRTRDSKKPPSEPKSHGPCCVCGVEMVSRKPKRVVCDRVECRKEYHRRFNLARRGSGSIERVCPFCSATYIVHGGYRKFTCGADSCKRAAKVESKRRRRAELAFWEMKAIQNLIRESADE